MLKLRGFDAGSSVYLHMTLIIDSQANLISFGICRIGKIASSVPKSTVYPKPSKIGMCCKDASPVEGDAKMSFTEVLTQVADCPDSVRGSSDDPDLCENGTDKGSTN